MGIKDLPESLVIEKSHSIINSQQKNIKKSDILEKIKNILNENEGDRIIFNDHEFLTGNGAYISTDSDLLRGIQNYYPKLYSEIKKNTGDITALLQNLVDSKDIDIETITEKNRKKLFSVLRDIARAHPTGTTEKSVTNLTNAMIHSPRQSFFYARKKAIEMEEVAKKQIAEQITESTRKNVGEKYVPPTVKIKYRIKEAPTSFSTINVPNLFSLTRCQVFYYEEDYYDCVNRETLLIDIKDKNIRFGNDMEVQKKEHLIEKMRIGNIAITYPDFDYYFLYNHKRFGLQCIGGLSINKGGSATITIHNHNDGLRYGTKYINENNREYRCGSCTENGDVHPELAVKDTADFVDVVYKMLKKL